MGTVCYDNQPWQAECFLLNGRYYYKLRDIGNATTNALAVYENSAKENDVNGYNNSFPSSYSTFPTLMIDYDMASNAALLSKAISDIIATPNGAK